MMRSQPYTWSFVLVISAIAALLAVFGELVTPLRAVIVLWFLAVCPGMAIVRLLRLGEGWVEWTVAVALSLALDALVAAGMLFAGRWAPEAGLIILTGLTLLGVVLGLAQLSGRRLEML
jgi:hypothetical protein